MEQNRYRIRYRKGNIEIEVEGDKDFVVQEFDRLKELGQYIEEKGMQSNAGLNIKKEISLYNFISEKSPKNHSETTIALAYYLHKFREKNIFNVNDVSDLYKEARLIKPKNLNDTINLEVKKKHLMEAEEGKDGLKAWTITRDGIEYVEKELGENG